MHDLRQRRCPIITPMLLCPGVRRCSRIFFGRIVNRSEKLPQKI